MAPKGARARLQADIQAISQEGIPHIEAIGKGDTQDEFVITFSHPNLALGQVDIRVSPQESSGYPTDNFFIVYTNDDIPADIAKIFDTAMTETSGMLVKDMLKQLTRRLCASLDPSQSKDDSDVEMTDADADSDQSEEIDFGNDSEVSLEFGGGHDDDADADGYDRFDTVGFSIAAKLPAKVLERICQDFYTARNAGFRIAKISGLDELSVTNIAAVSLRVSKLCLPEETRDAWNLASSDYVVVLVRYTGCYPTFENLILRGNPRHEVEFRVRKCTTYRPTLEQAMKAFGKSREASSSDFDSANSSLPDRKLSNFFIGDSLELLLNGDFIPMMQLRESNRVSWDDAKQRLSALTKPKGGNAKEPKKASVPQSARSDDEILHPAVLAHDHLSSEGDKSFPLILGQFVFRYLVKCLDYCMICHEGITGNLEAIKPYVCDNPLCLFQYMNLGLGPSIDHEIVSQPYVVDLLTSFCYASLQYAPGHPPPLREFPVGLEIQVPQIRLAAVEAPKEPHYAAEYGNLISPISVKVFWEDQTVTITDEKKISYSGLKTGQWVVLCTEEFPEGVPEPLKDQVIKSSNWNKTLHHAYITYMLGPTFRIKVAARHTLPATRDSYDKVDHASVWNAGFNHARLILYNRPFDEIESPQEKAFSLSLLLHSLPPIREMRSFIMESRSRQLATWDRIPPSAMKLLRWIVASNRSYIVQVDKIPTHDDNSKQADDQAVRLAEKIHGVQGWIQFRLAQGSPEKECRFREALQTVSKSQRSLVAWHGSPLSNWHSIIRQGLDFRKTSHGRAYGNGVYFSQSFDYSCAYAAMTTGQNGEIIWPQSALRINRAISLNELVNLPTQFINYQHNILVVDKLHWIQCRYLFVSPEQDWRLMGLPNAGKAPCKTIIPEIPPQNVPLFVQDPAYKTVGLGGTILHIPMRAFQSVNLTNNTRTSFLLAPGIYPGQLDETDEEEQGDIDFLDTMGHQPSKQSSLQPILPPTPADLEPKTDFRPGTLDFSKLQQLAYPSYATVNAQKILQRELQKLEQIQLSTPLHELGWYIDFERIENMFQWIVELHSFDESLPLAQDMKASNTTSIVLEIRFLRGFPMTPPFVRVIQPRFLPFVMGGGGHVTGGGAMCMELLTNTGWSPANSMESVFLQVRLAMMSLDPRPARLEQTKLLRTTQYGIWEAVDAYTRAANAHGWEVPKELQEAVPELRGSTSS
ncbi:hypothetical protein F5Y16DRAFT_30240 [Xylariaceae sp. FL0255]|nr:hypothetical protein F5Y16DRAFT_30240 [Xylariaceae sp. FL0255]